jgi:hypothetical protein
MKRVGETDLVFSLRLLQNKTSCAAICAEFIKIGKQGSEASRIALSEFISSHGYELPVLGQGDCVGIADRTGDEVLRLGHTRYGAVSREKLSRRRYGADMTSVSRNIHEIFPFFHGSRQSCRGEQLSLRRDPVHDLPGKVRKKACYVAPGTQGMPQHVGASRNRDASDSGKSGCESAAAHHIGYGRPILRTAVTDRVTEENGTAVIQKNSHVLIAQDNAPHAGEAIGMDAVNGTPPGGLQSSVLHHSHHKVPTAGNRRNA